jgi:hypothetical protein
MRAITDELKKLDNILTYIGNHRNSSVSEEELKSSKLYDLEKFIFLEKEGMILCTRIPISYRLTQKGIVFISYGGYEYESKRKRMDRRSNLFYLLSSPLIALVSLLLSLFALIISLSANKNNEEQPLNFTSEIKLSFPEIKDTIIIFKEKLNDKNEVFQDSKEK